MNKQRFHGVTYGNILCFAVYNNPGGCFEISVTVNIDMTYTISMTQNGDSAVVHDISDKAVAATGNDQINERVFLQHKGNVLTCFKQLCGIS